MRDRIIKTAAERFARYGYHKTTIEEIAADLNKVKSSLYYYFRTKEEIFKAVIENALEKLYHSINENLKGCSSPKEKLYRFITSHLQSFAKITEGYSTLLDLYFLEHKTVQSVREIYDKKELGLIKSILDDGSREKEFSVKDIKRTAFVILTAIKGVEQEYAVKNSAKNVKMVSKAMAEILINGISKDK